jgi:L-iditol 2-dehydrogenase
MKSAYLVEPRLMEIREEAMVVPKATEILVKIAYCGICTLEQRLYFGDRKIYYPIIPGHEASGEIVEIGKDVITSHQVGDHVVLDLVNRCHTCPACLSGNSNLCENRFRKGQRVLGAFSEYMVVRPDQVYVVPKDLPLDEAAFAEPLSCCIRSLKKVNLQLGDTLLISGAGTMGLLHLKVAMAMGAKVIVSDINTKRLENALVLGADAVVDATDQKQFVEQVLGHSNGKGVDCCIITTPSKSAAESAFMVMASNGRLNIYTSYNDKPVLPMDMNTIHRNEYMVTGSEGRSEMDFYQSVRTLSNRKVHVAELVSKIYPLEEITAAVEAALVGDLYRVLVKVG